MRLTPESGKRAHLSHGLPAVIVVRHGDTPGVVHTTGVTGVSTVGSGPVSTVTERVLWAPGGRSMVATATCRLRSNPEPTEKDAPSREASAIDPPVGLNTRRFVRTVYGSPDRPSPSTDFDSPDAGAEDDSVTVTRSSRRPSVVQPPVVTEADWVR